MGATGDWVSREFYDKHRRGSRRIASNPVENRLGALTRMHMKTFTEMAMNRFQWYGLPESVNVRFLEHTLFYNSLAVFFQHETLGALALRGNGSGPLNMYDEQTKFRVFGNSFVQRILNAEQHVKLVDGEAVTMLAECVPIWGNYLRTPDIDYAMIYASKLADLDLTIEVNAHNSRYTRIVTADESARLSVSNVNRQIDEGQHVVFVNGVFDPTSIGTIDIEIDPMVHLNLPILRTRIHSDAMSLFGINNSNQDKKERLVADEVAANNDQVAVMRDINLNARREACKAINRLFGLNTWVEYRTDSDPITPQDSNEENGDTIENGEDDESVYANIE